MSKEEDKTKILLDADVIINFINGNKLSLLAKIFPNRFCIIDRVKIELSKRNSAKIIVDNFIQTEKIEEISFPDTDYEILREYSILVSTEYGLGDGESACLAYARFRATYISSSNLADVSKYCKEHNIKNIPTMELLREAMRKRIMTEHEIDVFIQNCLSKGDRLPARNWKDYEKVSK